MHIRAQMQGILSSLDEKPSTTGTRQDSKSKPQPPVIKGGKR